MAEAQTRPIPAPLEKPPHGAPCNRCGLCCEDSLCHLGKHVFRQVEGPCPALSYDGQMSVCGLVEMPARFARVRAAMVGPTRLREAAITLIGAGIGCDGQVEGEPADLAFRRWMSAWHSVNYESVTAALKSWGARP